MSRALNAFLAFFVCLMAFASNAQATSTFTVHDGYITDEVNGLDFLRLDTPGITSLSWNELNTDGFDALGSNWILASPEQVLAFWNSLDPLANYTDLSFSDARDYDALIHTLDVVGRTHGEAAQGWTSLQVSDDDALWGYVWWNGGYGVEYPPYYEPPGDFGLNQVDSVNYRGHSAWLIRPSVVPLPFALPMFGAGIVVLGLLNRRKRQN
ncbi:VPLPA-CTERM sorting domain-containing protein [Sneathiella limimaris]|uniref:VPLPA-CTERM sorting domain-containing protein n=1 Tax=Sneathiella limimaris TaxID=1964213 RepID=UPI00146E0CA2|nr:VPLPA-CTERM sorting domain-containing protein [Sneathiella limimaris]